jgi:large subunit ribosomal protein L13
LVMKKQTVKPLITDELEWHHFDAGKLPVGRLATQIATLLQGKNREDYVPNQAPKVYVVVTNTDNAVFTGAKETQKQYRWYSGYPGGLRSRSVQEQRRKDSRKIIEQAVLGMLPKNKLRPVMMKHLKIYPGEKHPHLPQV